VARKAAAKGGNQRTEPPAKMIKDLEKPRVSEHRFYPLIVAAAYGSVSITITLFNKVAAHSCRYGSWTEAADNDPKEPGGLRSTRRAPRDVDSPAATSPNARPANQRQELISPGAPARRRSSPSTSSSSLSRSLSSR